ncbi:hypothetical protein ONZ43_g6185 [Nemania bipapillata]|uniref:Uncharacterized protein n=1 Tax=Nemania bipapillata TaxID=110536 RepID=A0ACC2I1M0_9PEZI|nr:hypothetical protein ONZ43_g6185 [Nemania bipapillata]
MHKFEQPESAEIEITGSRADVIEILEQLLWITATFRNPQGGAMMGSQVNLTLKRDRTHEPELSLLSPHDVPFEFDVKEICWISFEKASWHADFRYYHEMKGWGLSSRSLS